ncbi:MAG: MgtC/SapB family protein [Firmicutes bacterium]|nr:MgtC/SapB family protein [Bacillota bacterium]MBQ6536970.1 MgtC/SapB family protein [Bacillota bacterium]MBQ6606648.1 MgtC/SapB family protein [Bacillota bacterium]
MAISNGEIIFRLLLASVVGLLFGIDRERANKPAGVRTFLIVCLASCVLAIVSAYGFPSVAGEYQGINLVSDPARLMVGVLTGIGFIGAGIIWRSPRGDVSGVTTAAGILMQAALGICCGLGLYLLVAVAGPIALIALVSERLPWRKDKKEEKHERPPVRWE